MSEHISEGHSHTYPAAELGALAKGGIQMFSLARGKLKWYGRHTSLVCTLDSTEAMQGKKGWCRGGCLSGVPNNKEIRRMGTGSGEGLYKR